MASSKPGSFSAYLKYAQRGKNESNAAAPASSPLALLRIIAQFGGGALPVLELAERADLRPSDMAAALKALVDSELVSLEGDSPNQRVKLTPKGLEVARLA